LRVALRRVLSWQNFRKTSAPPQVPEAVLLYLSIATTLNFSPTEVKPQ